jgi:regulator of protease activity HflC (stomatin/prohibitin superfamily)
MRSLRLLLALFAAALSGGCAAVPPQHVGVLETFGKVHDATWSPGLHAWAPWFGVHRINCRTMQLEERTTTPTGEGSSSGWT